MSFVCFLSSRTRRWARKPSIMHERFDSPHELNVLFCRVTIINLPPSSRQKSLFRPLLFPWCQNQQRKRNSSFIVISVRRAKTHSTAHSETEWKSSPSASFERLFFLPFFIEDFGFANIFETNGKLQTFCGSPPYVLLFFVLRSILYRTNPFRYAAPELFQSLPYSPEKVDVWVSQLDYYQQRRIFLSLSLFCFQSLGVLLYIFVCGHLPFDSQNLSELRKQVLSGQLRLPFYLSTGKRSLPICLRCSLLPLDCSSLISHMLTTDPEQRYTIEKIKNHPWLRGDDASEVELTIRTPTIPNGQLTNAILDQAELLGYDRQQILKSVNGNSYDSDAAIWHLLLEKFQKTCQIQHPQERIDPPALIDHSLSKVGRKESCSRTELMFVCL